MQLKIVRPQRHRIPNQRLQILIRLVVGFVNPDNRLHVVGYQLLDEVGVLHFGGIALHNFKPLDVELAQLLDEKIHLIGGLAHNGGGVVDAAPVIAGGAGVIGQAAKAGELGDGLGVGAERGKGLVHRWRGRGGLGSGNGLGGGRLRLIPAGLPFAGMSFEGVPYRQMVAFAVVIPGVLLPDSTAAKIHRLDGEQQVQVAKYHSGASVAMYS